MEGMLLAPPRPRRPSRPPPTPGRVPPAGSAGQLAVGGRPDIRQDVAAQTGGRLADLVGAVIERTFALREPVAILVRARRGHAAGIKADIVVAAVVRSEIVNLAGIQGESRDQRRIAVRVERLGRAGLQVAEMAADGGFQAEFIFIDMRIVGSVAGAGTTDAPC